MSLFKIEMLFLFTNKDFFLYIKWVDNSLKKQRLQENSLLKISAGSMLSCPANVKLEYLLPQLAPHKVCLCTSLRLYNNLFFLIYVYDFFVVYLCFYA